LLAVLDHTESSFSSFVNSATSHYQQAIILSVVSAVIINNIILSADYNYSSAENVLSTADKLKIAAEILCCQVKRLNVSVLVALLALSSHLCQLHSYSLLHHCSEQ